MQSQHQEEKGVGDMEGKRENKLEIKVSNKDGVGIIPIDVLFGVLVRLPVKSLGRFKIVSKPWQILIEDRKFVDSHYRRSLVENDASRQYLMVEVSPFDKEQEEGKAKCYEVDNYDKPGPAISYRAIAFCEGLVCYLGIDEHVHVVNPITQQALTLPKPQCLRTRVKGILYQHRRYALGFGFDSVSSKYKVVIVVSAMVQTHTASLILYQQTQLAEMFMLGSESKSWKEIDSSILYTRVPFVGSSVYVNGASYWRSNCSEDDIVSFNFIQEKFAVIPVRRDMDEFFSDTYNHRWGLRKKGENLCVIGIVAIVIVQEVKLWTLTNYDEATPEWVVQKIIMPYELFYKQVRFITAAIGDELWIVCCDLGTELYKTYLYSYSEHGAVVNTREVCHFPDNYGFKGFHVESLVDPKDI